MNRIPINPTLLTWARERAGLDAFALAEDFPKLISSKIWVKQAERFFGRVV